MRITAVRGYAVRLHHRNLFIVTIDTDTGLTGLGVTFDAAVAPRYAFERWEAPHYRRRDGAVTNW